MTDNFSLIVMALIFVVAVPGVVFIFSNASDTSGELVLDSEGVAYPDQGDPYAHSEAGVLVPIYGPDGTVVRYEKRVHTKAGEHFRPSVTPSELRSGCPDGMYNIPLARVDEYKAMGRTVQVFGDNACWYPHTY